MEHSVYTTAIIIIQCICTTLFLYQGVYMVVAFVKKVPEFEAKEMCSYAVVIAAKNEEKTIGNLIKSIQEQDYPKQLISIFVVADNCSDSTASLAGEAGAVVYERFDESLTGKGHALQFLFQKIDEDYGFDSFDGYVVFDADNLLEENYITEINKVFSNGYRICTSYRNSKNYGANWISACSGLWFLRECGHLNHARMVLGVSCMVSGTGYVVHRDILRKNGGWKFFLLTEDTEFSIDSILKGETIGYCEKAVFYDEQPVKFSDSMRQRLRWAKGFYQVLYKNFTALVKGLFSRKCMTCFDALIVLTPGYIFLVVCASTALLTAANAGWDLVTFLRDIAGILASALIGAYILGVVLGFLVLASEHRKIYCRRSRAVLYVFAFPIFMLSYIPIAVTALFTKVKWRTIEHTFSYNLNEMKSHGGEATH